MPAPSRGPSGSALSVGKSLHHNWHWQPSVRSNHVALTHRIKPVVGAALIVVTHIYAHRCRALSRLLRRAASPSQMTQWFHLASAYGAQGWAPHPSHSPCHSQRPKLAALLWVSGCFVHTVSVHMHSSNVATVVPCRLRRHGPVFRMLGQAAI